MNTSTSDQHSETLSGLIERITFHSDETGFTVLRIKAKGFRDLVTVVGSMPSRLNGYARTGRTHWKGLSAISAPV